MKTTKHLMLLAMSLLLMHCSKDDGPTSPEPVAEPIQKSSAKQILSFRFTGLDNDGITIDISAEIDEQAKTITATLPTGTDITALEPTVEIPPRATLELTGPQDFSTPINYTVTAEDGSSRTYLVTLSVALSQKEILLRISAANPGNTLEWDPNDVLHHWEEVTLDVNGKVVALQLSTKNLTILPPEIGQLRNLEGLLLSGNAFSVLPQEIGQLGNLKTLVLHTNGLSALPPEIGQLGNLITLELYSNGLSALPPEIGQLSNLRRLELSSNALNTLPPEIGQLVNLENLYLSRNALDTLPPEIGQLSNLLVLDLRNNNLSNFNHIPFVSSGPVTIGCSTDTNLGRLWLDGNEGLEILDECICNLDMDMGGTVDIDVVPDGVRCVGDVVTFKD